MKGQSLVMQFVLFFLIGFTIFLAVGNLFKTQSDMFREDVASLSAKLANTYLSSAVITATSTCKQCDYVDIAVKIPETYAGQYLESSLSSVGLSVSTINQQIASSLHNLNSSFDLSGKSSSAMSKWITDTTRTITTFSDESSTKIVTLLAGGSDADTYIKIPKNAIVADARISLRGEIDNEASWSSSGSFYRFPASNAVDENWGSYAYCYPYQTCDIYENYSLPQATDVKWKYRTYTSYICGNTQTGYCWDYGSGSWLQVWSKTCSTGTFVSDLPQACSSDTTKQLRISFSPNYRVNLYYESSIFYSNYPSNVAVDTGNDGKRDIQLSGDLDSFQSNLDLNKAAIQEFLGTCVADDEGYCLIPLRVSSESPSTVELSNLKIDYFTSYEKVDKPITLTYNKNKNKIEVS